MVIYEINRWRGRLVLPFVIVFLGAPVIGWWPVSFVLVAGVFVLDWATRCPRCGCPSNMDAKPGWGWPAGGARIRCSLCNLDFRYQSLGGPIDPNEPDTRVKYKDPTTGKEYY